MPDYGKAFALWRGSAKQQGADLWSRYTAHDFVEGLRAATLPRASFLHYLAQDYVFLVHFSRAWALAVVKSETLAEMQHHVKTCASYGIDEQALFSTIEASENLAYTRYVLDAGYSGDLADLLAALAPCIFGYSEIGARLAQETAVDNPYAEWIDTYAGDEYQQVCRDVGALLDQALERRIGADFQKSPRWERLTDRFITATRLEVGFWDMGLRP